MQKFSKNIFINFLLLNNINKCFISSTINCNFSKNNINKKLTSSSAKYRKFFYKKSYINNQNILMTSSEIASYFEGSNNYRRCFEDVTKSKTGNQQQNNYKKQHNAGQQKYNYNKSQQFTVMSYNILSQDLLELHPYLYERHQSNSLIWENRLNRITNEILTIKPEILCLQEVQDNHLCMIIDKLKKLNYNCIYKKKTGCRNDGCAIFYNKYLFNLIEWDGVEFCQPNIEHLDRENVALIAKFHLVLQPDAQFLVSTTHLLYNPKRQDVRLAQVQVLLAELDRLSVKSNGNNQGISISLPSTSSSPSELQFNNELQRIPIILTGDFNFQPYSAPYRLITEGNLCYEGLSRLSLESPKDPDLSNHKTGLIFLPPKLGITDNCKHIDILINKYQNGHTRLNNSEFHSSTTNNIDEEQQQKKLEIIGTTIDSSVTDNDDFVKKYPNLFSTGRLTHDLNFKSAYNHYNINGEMEATTHQYEWVTVDYIFYSKGILFPNKSCSSKTKNGDSGKYNYKNNSNSSSGNNSKDTDNISDDNNDDNNQLKLISRYTVPSVNESKRIGTIPNSHFGSDHFSIAAEFLLYFPLN